MSPRRLNDSEFFGLPLLYLVSYTPTLIVSIARTALSSAGAEPNFNRDPVKGAGFGGKVWPVLVR